MEAAFFEELAEAASSCWQLLVLIVFGGGGFSAGLGGRFQGVVNSSLVEAAFL